MPIFRSSWRLLLSRAFWLLMLVGHAPAQVGAVRYALSHGVNAETFLSELCLTASMVFFVLKLVGVSWLRFRVDGRSIVALTLVVAVLHLDCLSPQHRDEFLADCAVVLAITPLALLADPQLRRRFRRVLTAMLRCGAGGRPAAHFGRPAWSASFLPRSWFLLNPSCLLRAPPGRTC